MLTIAIKDIRKKQYILKWAGVERDHGGRLKRLTMCGSMSRGISNTRSSGSDGAALSILGSQRPILKLLGRWSEISRKKETRPSKNKKRRSSRGRGRGLPTNSVDSRRLPIIRARNQFKNQSRAFLPRAITPSKTLSCWTKNKTRFKKSSIMQYCPRLSGPQNDA